MNNITLWNDSNIVNNITFVNDTNMVNNIISIHAGPESHHVNYHRNKTRQEILEKMSKSVNITCPEINNITFTNDPPYDILGIPQCQGK